MRRRRVTSLVAAAMAGIALIAASSAAPPAITATRADTSAQYEVYDVRTPAQRNAIASTGAAIDGTEHAIVEITATGSEVKALRALGFTVKPGTLALPTEDVSTLDFPSRDAAYHNYSEMIAEV